MPVSNMVLKLTDDSIVCIRPFRKQEANSFKNYHVYCSKYFEGNAAGMGIWKYFIIFSKRHFSAKTLRTPENIRVDADTIKIAYGKRTMRKLDSMLPDYLTRQIKNMLTQAWCKIGN